MAKQERLSAEDMKAYLPDLIRSAYDLASAGMGIHLHAVASFATGKDLPDWAKSSLSGFSCNYLVTPYVHGWRGIGIASEYGPLALSPSSEANLRLMESTDEEYARLGREKVRFLLGGEEAVVQDNAEEPFIEEEFQGLLVKAHDKGLIKSDPQLFAGTRIPDDLFSLAVGLLRAASIKEKPERDQMFKDVDNLGKEIDAVEFSDQFKLRLLQAAVHKLGCMLGLTEQVSFEAKELGSSFPRGYKPTRDTERWETGWQKVFGEPLPDLDGLYRQAHAVLVSFSDKDDLLVAHLLPLDRLPHLAGN